MTFPVRSRSKQLLASILKFNRIACLCLFCLPSALAAEDWQAWKQYLIGDVVDFVGGTYIALSDNAGVEPSSDAEIWDSIGSHLATSETKVHPRWSATTIYDRTRTVVAHRGKLWQNTSWSKGEEPGQDGVYVWQSIGINFNTTNEFNFYQDYQAGDVVLWKNALWEALFDTSGEEPGTTNAWLLSGYSLSIREVESDTFTGTRGSGPLSGGGPWQPEASYVSEDIIVQHRGLLWSNSAPALPGEEPGAEGVDVWYLVGMAPENNIPEWDYVRSYDGSQAVKFGQYIWVSKNKTVSQQPDQSRDWLLAKAISYTLRDWDGTVRYPEGFSVRYNNDTWISVQETQGNVPGQKSDGVFWSRFSGRNISNVFYMADWQAERSYPFIGMLASYLDQVWLNTAPIGPGQDTPNRSSFWELLQERGRGDTTAVTEAVQLDDDAWSVSRSYSQTGHVVTYQGVEYFNIVPVTGGNPPNISPDFWQPVTDPNKTVTADDDTEVWKANYVYEDPGLTVLHNGREYTNLHWTQGDTPGASAVWQPTALIDAEEWNQYFVYDGTREYRVTYQGKIYATKEWSQGDIPGQSLNWIATASAAQKGQAWSATTAYPAADWLVEHEGRNWYSLWATIGDEPGKSDVWQPETIYDGDPWNAYVIYDGKSRQEGETFYTVSHNGKTWTNQWWTQGDEPGVQSVWAEDGLQTAYTPGEPWDAQRVYDQVGMQVTFTIAGVPTVFYSTGITQGQMPGTNTVWQPVTIVDGDPWSQHVIYDYSARQEPLRHYIVTHNGQRWQNQWYALGMSDEPGNSLVWTNVGSTAPTTQVWDRNRSYSTANMQVEYPAGGQKWYNLHYTQGDEPGRSAVWQPVTIPAGDAWNSFVVYDSQSRGEPSQFYTVTYNGTRWTSTGYSQGDTPGANTVWQPVTIVDGADWSQFINYDNVARSESNRRYKTAHNGNQWINTRATLGEEPGKSTAWERTNVPAPGDTWQANYPYGSANMTVTYPDGSGQLWYNLQYSLGETPGASTAWQPVTLADGDPWQTYIHYDATLRNETKPHYIVTHGGIQWRNSWATQGETPGVAGVWQPVTITDGDPWSPLYIYDSVTRAEPGRQYIVSHNGQSWRNLYYTVGEVPGQSPAWELNYTHTNGDVWRADYTYATNNMQVEYPAGSGDLYFNVVPTKGVAPQSASDWQPVVLTDGDAWQSYIIYSATARSETRPFYEVSHNGKLWRISNYSLNVEPGTSADWQPTTLVDGDPWDRFILYDASTRGEGSRQYIVTHNGDRWLNQYYTLGDEPGTNTAWARDYTHQNGDLWRSDYIYATAGRIVEYPSGGAQWYNTGYTLGDIPDQTVEWQPVTITDGDPWDPLVIYDASARNEGTRKYIVTYNGKRWVNQYYSLGDVPGQSSVWTPNYSFTTGDPWRSGFNYQNTGMVVSYPSGGKLWYNITPNQGVTPGTTTDWQPVTLTDGDPWDTLVIYDGPSRGEGTRKYVVTHNGDRWINQYYTQGIAPGSAPDWQREYSHSDGDLWRSDYTYATAGKIVVHPSGGPSWFNTGYTLGDTPGSSVEWQPQTITDGDPWNSLVLYDAATRNEGSRQYVVAHNGELWVNQYYTLGDVPGSSPAWARQYTHANGDLWRADYVYATAGKIVVYPSGGSSWYNSGYSLGDQPDQTVVWQPVTITDGDPWDPLVIYDASTRNEGNRQYVVTHNGERWVNQYYSLGDQPGTSAAWARDYTFTAGDAWRSDYVYSQPNMVVAYPNAGGKLWFNTAYSLGDTPTVSTVWQPVTLTDGDPWDPLVIYSASARSETRSYYEVSHNGKLWRNSTYSLNEEPGKSAAWQPSTLVDNDPWDANIIYDGPTRGEGNRTYIVTHAGQIWSNAYYSLGDEPGSSPAWVPVVTHSDGDIWSATYIYATAGAIVRYPANGALWYNLYYSANEQPGTTQTWQPVSIVDEDPWQANVIYDATTRGEGSRFYIVSHNGSLWQNTTYSVGETPSATAVTWAPVALAGDGIPLWNSATVYSVAGTIVKDANGRKWYNEYWTQNDAPGASNVWQPVTITDRDPWSRYIFYSASRRNEGTRKYLVSYNGAIWQNQWDTQGETPGVSAVWAPGP
jgi:hypothetical protein